uniref:Uncharacterized protein n=1 Tax=uncultured organism TaxID=155900 RepID=M1QA77_9ZZZZ|nr:hypothetical protein FLSS-2_0029 [uncultured organism]
MGLNEDQAEILEELDVGEAVMKVKGKWDEPFLVKVDPVELSNVSDREVREHSKNFLKEMEEYVVPREKKTSERKSKKEKSEEVTKQEHLLLENIARFPYLSISERKEKLGWGNSRLSNMRKKLRSKGYIRKKRLKKPEGGRGSTLTILEATGKARKYLKEQGIKTKYIGRGGAVHSYYMQWFLDNLKRKSVDVSYETDIGGISVDLFIVKRSGKTQAIEIEVSSSENTLNKLKKLLEMVDRVLIVSDKKVLVDDFKQGIEEMNIAQDRVSIKKIQDIEF